MNEKRLKILVCGATGFIGSRLIEELVKDGYELIIATKVHLKNVDILVSLVNEVDGIINLCGTSLFAKWSKKYKQKIYDSRILASQALVDACFLAKEKPKFFISASSVAIYTDVGVHDEESNYFGIDYLSFLTKDWENEVERLVDSGIRIIILRLGHVLGNGGVLKELTPFIKSGLCTIPGDGKQSFAWIHIDDVLNFIKLSIECENIKGVYNLVAPENINISGFFKVFAKILKRPVWRYMPFDILKMRYKEGYDIFLKSAFAKSKRLKEIDFDFKYKDINSAIKDIFR